MTLWYISGIYIHTLIHTYILCNVPSFSSRKNRGQESKRGLTSVSKKSYCFFVIYSISQLVDLHQRRHVSSMGLLCTPLLQAYVLLIIIVAYFNLQDELSVKLLEFLESPRSTTDSLLVEKEQVQLILHLLLHLWLWLWYTQTISLPWCSYSCHYVSFWSQKSKKRKSKGKTSKKTGSLDQAAGKSAKVSSLLVSLLSLNAWYYNKFVVYNIITLNFKVMVYVYFFFFFGHWMVLHADQFPLKEDVSIWRNSRGICKSVAATLVHKPNWELLNYHCPKKKRENW